MQIWVSGEDVARFGRPGSVSAFSKDAWGCVQATVGGGSREDDQLTALEMVTRVRIKYKMSGFMNGCEYEPSDPDMPYSRFASLDRMHEYQRNVEVSRGEWEDVPVGLNQSLEVTNSDVHLILGSPMFGRVTPDILQDGDQETGKCLPSFRRNDVDVR